MNNNSQEKKVAFLFGAGAEGKYNFDLPMGNALKKMTLFLNNGAYTYSEYYMVEYEKASKRYNYYLHLLKKYFNDNYFRHSHNDVGNSKNGIKYNLSKLNSGVHCKNKKEMENMEEKLLRRLDGYFNSIVDPKNLGINKFAMVINYYWTCYFCILESVLVFMKRCGINYLDDYIINKNIKDFRKLDNKAYLDIGKILDNLKDFIKKLYDVNFENVEAKKYTQTTYYGLIKHWLLDENNGNEKKISLSGIITTNYYDFAKKIMEVSEDKIAYINGKLSLFEQPEILKVSDLENNNVVLNSKKIYFPFIFGQSYIKPIVSSNQVDEIVKMKKILDESDSLVILGYGINNYDNHLNYYLREYVDRGKRIIYVHDDQDDGENYNVIKQLIYDQKIEELNVKYGENQIVINEIIRKVECNG